MCTPQVIMYEFEFLKSDQTDYLLKTYTTCQVLHSTRHC